LAIAAGVWKRFIRSRDNHLLMMSRQTRRGFLARSDRPHPHRSGARKMQLKCSGPRSRPWPVTQGVSPVSRDVKNVPAPARKYPLRNCRQLRSFWGLLRAPKARPVPSTSPWSATINRRWRSAKAPCPGTLTVPSRGLTAGLPGLIIAVNQARFMALLQSLAVLWSVVSRRAR